MKLLNLTLPSVAEDLALDEALLLQAEAGQGGEVLRLWEARQAAVVLGVSGKVMDETCADTCRADGVPILRRSSGGGTVLLGPGCLCYSLVLSYRQAAELEQIGCSYCWILGKLAAALADLAPGIAPAGTSDLAVAGRKVSGNSQQRKRRYLLHHGTLLYGMTKPRLSRYLKLPPRQPDYRVDREHDAFVGTIDVNVDTLRQRCREAWQADEVMNGWPAEVVRRLVDEKYGRSEWSFRR